MKDLFFLERRVAFADTDAMRVTHHANYLRYCEEARVAWMRERALHTTHFPHADRVLAVLEYRVRHRGPSTFDDLLRVTLQVRREGARVRFHYKVTRDEDLIAEAETLHIAVDERLRPAKPSRELTDALSEEPWIETWLSNS